MSFALEVQVGREPGPPGAIALRMALPVPSRFPPRMAPLFSVLAPNGPAILSGAWVGREDRTQKCCRRISRWKVAQISGNQPNSDRREYSRCDDGGAARA